ncbi:MAG TPA: 6-phosphogluconolactonase, partial [Luteimonas sp.]
MKPLDQEQHKPDMEIAGPRVHFLSYQSAEQWAWAGAVTLAAELRRALEQRPRARLLLSGGSTPGPVYEALSRAPLEWSRIDVALVDERWL